MPQRSADVRPLSLGNRPLHLLVERQRLSLARSLVAGFVEEIPMYRQLPHEEITGDITRITAHNLSMIAGVFRDRRAPTEAELAPLRSSAARRAQEGVPLNALLTAYHVGARRVWDHLFGDPAPGDLEDVTAASSLILVYTQAVTSAVCDAYLEERERMLSQEQHARHAVLTALLNGDDPATAGPSAGVRISSRYLVLTVEIAPHPDEDRPGTASAVAGRRKLHRATATLDAFASEPALTAFDATGGLALVPLGDCAVDWDAAGELVRDMSRAAGADVRSAAETAAPAGIPAAVTLTQEILDVARSFARPPGLYRLSDVLLEYQLTRPSVATGELAGLLDPLAGSPGLLRTVEVHLGNGLDRRRTAAALHVHPNTVDYRLRRVACLTGLDAADPADLQRIGAALAARRVLAGGRR
ncbi:helix-turn-helix domain-containing protein [Phytomonospora sp. NPDC050363]|uniref:PucR family transcriptional regulator n=1 Tax=Phytomonospora sp. NPDC050363 TaxID=3155642 RepID=UPI0033FDFBE4